MNIFVLSLQIVECAMFHCDQHVIKMILESAQLLCSVVVLSGGQAGYRAVLVKHPCTLWALKSLANWKWLYSLALALNDEYKYRYNKSTDHKSLEIIKELKDPNIPDIGLTSFAQAMPIEFKDPDPVVAYRNYYAGAKFKFATWRVRGVPQWYVELRQKLGGDAEKEIEEILNPENAKRKRKEAKELKAAKMEKREKQAKIKEEKFKRKEAKDSNKAVVNVEIARVQTRKMVKESLALNRRKEMKVNRSSETSSDFSSK